MELVNALIDVGLDWMAVEILEVVVGGLTIEASPEAIEIVQGLVRNGDYTPHIERVEEDSQGPMIRELDGEAQTEWASTYVLERIRDVIQMSATNIERLNEIGGEDTSPRSRTRRDGEHAGFVTLQLGIDGVLIEPSSGRADEELLVRLEDALESWKRDAGGDRS